MAAEETPADLGDDDAQGTCLLLYFPQASSRQSQPTESACC